MNIDPTKEHFTGKPVRRSEDVNLVKGLGRYSDDEAEANQAYAYVLRSPYAHGRIRALDLDAARATPGVLGVYVAADLAAYKGQPSPFAGMVKFPDGSPMRGNGTQTFAKDKVRYVGDPVALVVAETEAAARDGAEAIGLDVEMLPAVTDARAACAFDGEPIYADAPDNVAVEAYSGEREKVAQAFADAAHIARLNIINNRLVVAAMEPRALLVAHDAQTDRFTFKMQSQGVFGMRGGLAYCLGVKPEQVRVLTGQVGGSFGMKGVVFPEYVALAHAARALGRPIKWTESRTDSFVSDHQGRDHDLDAELALDKDGNFLALRLSGYGNIGAYMSPFGVMIATINIHRNAQSVYRTPLIEHSVKAVFTNTPPIGAYRGAGRPEGNYIMERLIDTAAREMGIDGLELRRRNHIRPEEMPFKTGVGSIYDSGDFPALLEATLKSADWEGYPARKAQSEKRGKLRGRGLGQYLEITAPPMKELGAIRFEENGDVTILTGTLDFGQGHATTFAQVLADKIGAPFERIRLIQGDSDQVTIGGGTGGSKSIMASGAAILGAGDQVIEKGKQAAAHFLETALADIEFSQGAFRVAGTDRSINIMDLAQKLREAPSLPDGLPRDLNAWHVHEMSPSAYPNGCHVAEVEIDPETGVIEVVRYSMTNDFGNIINPMIVEAQAHGGVVQAIGQALLERTVFDEEGQFLSGTFTDYAMPRADNAPFFEIHSRPTPALTNPLGAKGCGEAGCAGGLPSIMNAIVDALSPLGVRHVNMPATPETIWRMIQDARKS